jgi:hypothetical protein
MYTLTFEALHEYDAGDLGITVPVELSVGDESVKVTARLDSGSTFCVFRRARGEALGFDIESGTPQWISTATGSFLTYGHEDMLSGLGFQLDVMVFFAADESFNRDVLGRHGWIQQLKLGIVDYDGKLYVSKYDA